MTVLDNHYRQDMTLFQSRTSISYFYFLIVILYILWYRICNRYSLLISLSCHYPSSWRRKDPAQRTFHYFQPVLTSFPIHHIRYDNISIHRIQEANLSTDRIRACSDDHCADRIIRSKNQFVREDKKGKLTRDRTIRHNVIKGTNDIIRILNKGDKIFICPVDRNNKGKTPIIAPILGRTTIRNANKPIYIHICCLPNECSSFFREKNCFQSICLFSNQRRRRSLSYTYLSDHNIPNKAPKLSKNPRSYIK